jgi:hypothetical protein
VQAEWGEITLSSPGRLGRAAARNAGRVTKPPHIQERSDPQSPMGRGENAASDEDAIALVTSGERAVALVVAWCLHDWLRRRGQRGGER